MHHVGYTTTSEYIWEAPPVLVRDMHSTESKLVGIDNFMPMVLWTHLFMKPQSYEVKNNIVYQDKDRKILLDKNGKA